MGKKYDGRKTDSWALGVVLFAIGTGGMPFVEDGEGTPDAGGKRRKNYLMKIAKGDYKWPTPAATSKSDLGPTLAKPHSLTQNHNHPLHPSSSSSTRLVTPALKSIVSKLLTRDSEKRFEVSKVWEEEWLKGEGGPNKSDYEAGWVEGEVEGDMARRGSEALLLGD